MLFYRYRLMFSLILLPVVLSGCSLITSKPICPENTKSIEQGIAGYSTNGQPIHYTRIGCGPQTTLVYGAIHGNEPASATLTELLIEKLEQLPDNWFYHHRVIAIPIVNPDGLHANTRANARGVDPNRNFPTQNRINNHQFGMRALSEPESQTLVNITKSFPPDRILSIHQPLACIDHDGPAIQVSRAIARHTDLPICNLGARPGSHGSYAGVERHIPIVTFEMRSQDHLLKPGQIWQLYGKAILAGITYPQAPPDL
ncbi:murein peptide amidase A [Nitrincola iocasae]|uniref:Murein peptide amidase A n=2 Tax=Nitrincola iocasae TaxID=2614693 RepID=A0A5J6LBS8_9GAMM|nr:murein peptide amidase A [Nitrincola iocasae]